MKPNNKYYLQFSVLCLGSLLLSYGLSMINSPYFKTSHFWIPTVFFAITSFLTNRLLVSTKDPKEFLFKALAINIGRLLICMILIFIYSMIHKETQLAFSCDFMAQYVTFTIFELSYILKHIRTNP